MRTGKVLIVCVLTSLLTSCAVFFLLQTMSQRGVFAQGDVTVPSVVGMWLDQARQILQPMKLSVIVAEQRTDPAASSGQIISQDPPAQGAARKGAVVRVVVSSGQARVKMPGLKGMTLSAALRALSAAGLKPGQLVRKPHAGVPKDQVVGGSVPAGVEVAPGTKVVLVISSGESLATVPKVVGMHVARARKALVAAKLKPGRIRETYNENHSGNVVLSQTPTAGSNVAHGTRVDLVINEGD